MKQTQITFEEKTRMFDTYKRFEREAEQERL